MKFNKDDFTAEQLEAINSYVSEETAKTRKATENKLAKNTIEKSEFDKLQNDYSKLKDDFDKREFHKTFQETFLELGGNKDAFETFKDKFGDEIYNEKENEKRDILLRQIKDEPKNNFFFEKKVDVSGDLTKEQPTEKKENDVPEFYPNTTIKI